MIKKIILLLVIIISLFSMTVTLGSLDVNADGQDIPFYIPPNTP